MERHSESSHGSRANHGGGGKAKSKAVAEALSKYIKVDLRDQANQMKSMFSVKRDKNGSETFNKEQIRVLMDEARFVQKNEIHMLQDLPFSNICVVKSVRKPVPYDPSLELIDLKLDVMGPKEDKYYGALPYLVKNIRRGNTLIRMQKGKQHSFILGRKGLMKFFDMHMEYIQKEHRDGMPGRDGYSETMCNEKNYILGPVVKALSSGQKVEVLKTLKANGENV